MTEKELRELDAWIAENVMGWGIHQRNTACYVRKGREVALMSRAEYIRSEWRPTTDRAASQEVLERCCEMTCPEIQRQRDEPAWTITARTFGSACNAKAETLPLAICLFAKKLFGKE